jgi:hypothetical protein
MAFGKKKGSRKRDRYVFGNYFNVPVPFSLPKRSTPEGKTMILNEEYAPVRSQNSADLETQ